MKHLLLLGLFALAAAQNYDYEQEARPAPQRIQSGYSGSAQPKPTPIPILKQINRHNEDGSYTYGYEGADGSFKIETKLATGEVKGKYGYTDDQGKVRVVEYGATKYGFEPSGEGITVAPPTLVDETTDKTGRRVEYADDYYEPQQQLVEERPAPRPVARPVARPVQYSAPQQFASPQNAGPVPARAQIAGAQLSSFDYVPQTRPAAVRSYQPAPQPAFRPQASYSYQQGAAQPAPIQEDSYDEPAPRPKITYAQPAAPQPRPVAPVQYAPRPQQLARPGQGGVLDQLAKDYALPQGGAAPLHDISFGYY